MTSTRQEVINGRVISKRYLFFLRHFNDIDNITPVIHEFLRSDPAHHAEVVLYDENYSGEGDSNLSLLAQAFPARFRWSWLGEAFGLDFNASQRAARWVNRLGQLRPRWMDAKRSIQTERNRQPRKPAEAAGAASQPSPTHDRWRWLPAGARSLADVRSGQAGATRIRAALAPLLDRERPTDLILFDVVRSHHVRGLLQTLRSISSAPICCLPVSPLINFNVLREYHFKAPETRDFETRHDYRGFDMVAFVDSLYLDHYRGFMHAMGLRTGLPANVACIGSLRYRMEWIRLRQQFLETSASRKGAEHLPSPRKRVLVLLSRLKSNVNVAELQASLDWLRHAPNLDVRIKGHTRAGAGDARLQIEGMTAVDQMDTSGLIDWSEAIVFWSTSAALEGYAKQKTMICLRYVSSNLNLYAHYEAGFVAHCRDDLVLFLTAFGRAETGTVGECQITRRYNAAGITRMLNEVVQAGHEHWDAHIDSILKLLASQEEAKPTDVLATCQP